VACVGPVFDSLLPAPAAESAVLRETPAVATDNPIDQNPCDGALES
jgi:hypothetical protein